MKLIYRLLVSIHRQLSHTERYHDAQRAGIVGNIIPLFIYQLIVKLLQFSSVE